MNSTPRWRWFEARRCQPNSAADVKLILPLLFSFIRSPGWCIVQYHEEDCQPQAGKASVWSSIVVHNRRYVVTAEEVPFGCESRHR